MYICRKKMNMMKKMTMVCALLLAMNSMSAYAQQSYPKDFFGYELECDVNYQGKAPKIGDFVNAFLSLDETSEVLGALYTAWNHYLRNEPQESCYQFSIDEKNGYLQLSFDSQGCEGFDEDVRSQYTYEMCYWNCADGKHKLIADNFVDSQDGKYLIGQYSGISFFLYDNKTRKIYPVGTEDIGAYVDASIDESNFETGEQMTMHDETVVVYRLPQQGKDINVEIYDGNRKTVCRLVWDGMRFHRE